MVACVRQESAVTSAPLPRASDSREFRPFPWAEQWYGVALEEDILESDLFEFLLFGKSYAVQRRNGVLSEVRSAGENDLDTTVRVHTECGIVFFWPGISGNADPKLVPLPKELRSEKATVLSLIMRTVPCSFEGLIENLVDAGHVYFAHHNARPEWRRDSPKITSDIGTLVSPDDVFDTPVDAQGGSFDSLFPTTRVRFRPPGLVWHQEVNRYMSTMFLNSCVDATNSRFILVLFARNPSPLALRLVFKFVPRWMMHSVSHVIVDGDSIIIDGIERTLGAHKNWKVMYGPPAGRGDSGVYKYRSWMDEHRSYIPGGAGELPLNRPKMDRRTILDRYYTHTIHCRDCSKALKRFRQLVSFSTWAMWIAANSIISMLAFSLVNKPVPVSQYVMRWSKILMAAVFVLFFSIRKYAQGAIADLTYSDKARRLFDKK